MAQLPDRSLTGVKVYRNNALLATLPGTPHQYIDATVVPNTYTYKVSCYYSSPNGESIFSNEVTVIIPPYVFNAPTNFTAVPGNASAVLNWAAPTAGTGTLSGFKVYKDAALVTTLPATTLTYTNTGLTNGTVYAFSVTATYTSPTGESAATTPINVTPFAPPPTNLTGTIVNSNGIHLAWNPPATNLRSSSSKADLPDRNLLGYRIYQGTHPIHDIMDPSIHVYDLTDLVNATYTFKVSALYTEGESAPSNTITISGNNDPVVPTVTALNGNYPNPFNPSTVVSYSVSKAGLVTLEIYNSLGQKVNTLVNKRVEAGNYTVTWNGTDDKGNPLGSGLYFYKMKSGNYSSTKKMILLK
jgi:hypothetical protein